MIAIMRIIKMSKVFFILCSNCLAIAYSNCPREQVLSHGYSINFSATNVIEAVQSLNFSTL